MSLKSRELERLDREADIASVAYFKSQAQVEYAEELLRSAKQIQSDARNNFLKRKGDYLRAKLGDISADEFKAQGIELKDL